MDKTSRISHLRMTIGRGGAGMDINPPPPALSDENLFRTYTSIRQLGFKWILQIFTGIHRYLLNYENFKNIKIKNISKN